MGISVGELVRTVGGKLYGDESVQIEGAQSIGKAGPGDITFVFCFGVVLELMHGRYRGFVIE